MPRPVLLLFLCALALAVAGASSAKTVLPGVRSPSGSVHCFVLSARKQPALLLCSVTHARYAKALEKRCAGPKGHGVDWHGFELATAGKGGVSCSGGALITGKQIPRYVSLANGKAWRHGAFTCVSQAKGLYCQSKKGHGLFMSQSSWQAW